MLKFDKYLNRFNYKIRPELIAQKPTSPRDSARLLVYNRKTKKVKLDIFKNIYKYLPSKSVIVFNQTKVLPARLFATKETGGKVEILYISHNDNTVKVLANRKLNLNSKVYINSKIYFTVTRKDQVYYILKPNFKTKSIKLILNKYGKTPLPPYIKNSPLNERQKREQYQTVFAKNGLSVAAPTASLHFTKKLIKNLKTHGIEVKFITLNVNLGTFAPLKEESLKTNLLHSENFEIPPKTLKELNLAKKQGKKIIAVGTTVVRTLESASQNGELQKTYGETKLFIKDNYKFQFVDSIVTNFHVPKSSLLMLISAFAGREIILKLYKLAIKNKFRFFSFGDGMLIL